MRAREPVQTKIIVTAFHVGRRERLGQDALEKRNVFLHQLFLQIFRAGGNDHATIAAKRRGNCGNEISERFASACSRLDDQMSLLFKRAHHRPRHVNLARSIFIFGMRPRNQSLRTKNFFSILVIVPER